MTLVEMRREAGMSQREFAEHYGIPVRTLQQWEQGKSTPPSYVLSMMEKLRPSRRRRGIATSPRTLSIPEQTRWRICVDRPFKNCDRVYPIQQKKVRSLLDDVARDPALKRVVIFGSSVTQRCHQGSDVDVYVEMSEDRSPVSALHDFAFDLWTNYTADDRLKAEIERNGVEVYG
ncbi:MAG: helix-turn-helix domain-containing protein [Adlercreutzia sp.]|nr:helix-turn-helix domain-containing protein [Adlercreutzia sp.]